MKKIISLLVISILSLSLVGCSTPTNNDEVDENLTITIAADMNLTFVVGDEAPDFSTYFVVSDENNDIVETNVDNLNYTIPVDEDNLFSEAGTYVLSIVIGTELKNVIITVEELVVEAITLAPGNTLDFQVGDYMPDFTTYFNAVLDGNPVEILPPNVLHTLLLNTNNMMTTAGYYEITVNAAETSRTFIARVVDPNAPVFEIDGTLGVFELYLIPGSDVEFVVGDYMPNFLSYFVISDGTEFKILTGDMIEHNLLLSADNIMTTAGSYNIYFDATIDGAEFTMEVAITVNAN